MYSDELLNRFYSPHNVGVIPDATVLGHEGNPTCGDVIEIYLRAENGIVSRARFRALGCAVAIAASDAVCELVTGMTITQATFLESDIGIDALGGVPDNRMPCLEAPIAALRDGLRSVRSDRA